MTAKTAHTNIMIGVIDSLNMKFHPLRPTLIFLMRKTNEKLILIYLWQKPGSLSENCHCRLCPTVFIVIKAEVNLNHVKIKRKYGKLKFHWIIFIGLDYSSKLMANKLLLFWQSPRNGS